MTDEEKKLNEAIKQDGIETQSEILEELKRRYPQYEAVITDRDISTGYITPQERLNELGARIVQYETSEHWVIDGKLVYIERTPIDWNKNITKGAMQ